MKSGDNACDTAKLAQRIEQLQIGVSKIDILLKMDHPVSYRHTSTFASVEPNSNHTSQPAQQDIPETISEVLEKLKEHVPLGDLESQREDNLDVEYLPPWKEVAEWLPKGGNRRS